MRACILSIGSELMLGQITDTNASWLARDLAEAGIELVQVTQVGDDSALLLRAMNNSLELADTRRRLVQAQQDYAKANLHHELVVLTAPRDAIVSKC